MGATVEFFSQFSCRLQIVDLLNQLPCPSTRNPDLPEDMSAAITQLLPDASQVFDLTLVWNVFDHLDPGPARVLARLLRRLSRPGARLPLWLENNPLSLFFSTWAPAKKSVPWRCPIFITWPSIR